MKKIRLTESDLHNIILSSVKRIINESNEHGNHIYDRYLDDDDFLLLCDKLLKDFASKSVSYEDFIEEENRSKLVSYVEDSVMDFVDYDAVNDFGYKYGNLTPVGYRQVSENIVNYLEKKFR